MVADPSSAGSSPFKSIPLADNSANSESILGLSELEEITGPATVDQELFI